MSHGYLLLAACAVGLLACRGPSRFANGSGYGVGIPRAAFTLGGGALARGETTQGFTDRPTGPDGTARPVAPAPRSK